VADDAFTSGESHAPPSIPEGPEGDRARERIAMAGDIKKAAIRLATAFPQLVRRVTVVATSAWSDPPIAVRVACEGVHEGMWGDIICPTRRRVAFEEQHQIVVTDGQVVLARIVLDVPAIVVQLCGRSAIDPDDTVRPGTIRW
jgi:predicted ester cyclase